MEARIAEALTAPPRSPGAVAADVVAGVMLVSGAVVLADGALEGGLRFVAAFALLVALRGFDVSRPFLAAFGVGILLASWANAAQWYEAGWWVDVALHFGVTGVTAAMAYLVLGRFDVLPDLHDGTLDRRSSPIILLTVALGLAIGAVWELYEWLATNVFERTSINVGYDDTILDLTMDGLGSLVAGIVLARWARMGRGIRRRSPEHPRGRDRERS